MFAKIYFLAGDINKCFLFLTTFCFEEIAVDYKERVALTPVLAKGEWPGYLNI